MERPEIVCHMLTSIDGKVTGNFLSCDCCQKATEIYYQINRDYNGDGFICGRITMEQSFTGGWYPELASFTGEKIEREDYIGDPTARFFAVAFDRQGRLGWRTSHIQDEDPGYDHAHIIEVLTEKVSDAYLHYLRSIGVSYIFVGEEDIDIPFALFKLKQLFGIEKLLLEGGSILNGAFQRAGVVDALSLVVVPMIAMGEDKPLFMESTAEIYVLTDCKQYDHGVLWLRYKNEERKGI